MKARKPKGGGPVDSLGRPYVDPPEPGAPPKRRGVPRSALLPKAAPEPAAAPAPEPEAAPEPAAPTEQDLRDAAEAKRAVEEDYRRTGEVAPWVKAEAEAQQEQQVAAAPAEQEVLPPSPPIDYLAEIRAGHRQYNEAWEQGCRGAIRAGDALTAKLREFGGSLRKLYAWIREGYPEVEGMASRYMRLARPENRDRVFHLPVRQALKLLAKPKATPDEVPAPDEIEEPDPEDIGHKNYALGMRKGEGSGRADARAGARRNPAAPSDYPDAVGARGWSLGYDRGYDKVRAKQEKEEEKAAKEAREEAEHGTIEQPEVPHLHDSYPVPSTAYPFAVMFPPYTEAPAQWYKYRDGAVHYGETHGKGGFVVIGLNEVIGLDD